MSMINQHSWMFISSYEDLRSIFVTDYTLDNCLHLGSGVFGEINGEVVQSTVFTYLKNYQSEYKPIFFRLINGDSSKKDKLFLKRENQFNHWSNLELLNLPKSILAYWISKKLYDHLINYNDDGYIKSCTGLQTGNNKLFVKKWYELSKYDINILNKVETKTKWIALNYGGERRKWYGNFDSVLYWKDNGKTIKAHKSSTIRNESYYYKEGITWTTITSKGYSARYLPEDFIFDQSGDSLFTENINHVLGIFNSKVSDLVIDVIAPTLNIRAGNIKFYPVIKSENHYKEVDLNIEISKKDWDSRENSWDFKQSPLVNESNNLKQAYQIWQDSITQDFFQLHANEEELNRIFIDIYGLQDELTPEVKLKDITILQEEINGKDLEALESAFRDKGKDAVSLPINKTEVLSQFMSYAIGVFLGRYRLDKPGLNIAHPNPTEQELASYKYNGHSLTIDDDGIVPLMGEDCAFPDDVLVRTEDLLLTIWGENALTENINFLREALGMDLHKWLTEKFWGYHTSMYKKKPIYWLFSSNVKKPQNAAFKVLVYMHRMDKYTVQQIQRNYLYPHQEYVKNEKNKLEEDEDSLNKEQQKHLELLRDWEIECRDYNEVLKTLANQQIEIDLDDGVTVNYAKFEGAVAII
jgi:hypothetical protein